MHIYLYLYIYIGWLPIFPAWNSYTDEMIGDHCTVFIADAFLKGIIKIDHNNNDNYNNDNYDNTDNDYGSKYNTIKKNNELFYKAYKYLVKNAFETPSDYEYKKGKGRRALKSYLKYGFIPVEDEILDSAHIKQQVSRTLEYSYDDYVVSQIAFLYSNKKKQERYHILQNIKKIRKNDINIMGMNENIEKEKLKIKLINDEIYNSNENGMKLLKRSQNYRWVVDGDGGEKMMHNQAINIDNKDNNNEDNVENNNENKNKNNNEKNNENYIENNQKKNSMEFSQFGYESKDERRTGFVRPR